MFSLLCLIVSAFSSLEGPMKRSILCLIVLVLVCPIAGNIKASQDTEEPIFDPAAFSGLKFRNLGPALMSGRIADIAIHPRDESIWYLAVGSGGVWKTVNSGTTWTPVFDSQPSYSIGCITLDPKNPDIVWVGTGENVSGRHVGFGDGVYKSLNGGMTWQNMGLKQSEHISKILVDPRDSRTIYVAAEGPLWSSGRERGLYKSTNGGKTWNISLEISTETGVTDVVCDFSDPDTLYAAAYQRRRSVAAFMGGGPESGIYKSEDAGRSWRKLKVGLPQGEIGKIGLAVSRIATSAVYATIEAKPEQKGFYRSTNHGESWEKRSSYTSGGTGPHYYQEIFADPHRFDRIYQMDVWLHVSEDGGKTFKQVGETHKHSDNHALAFSPSDPDFLLVGSDGGLYESRDRGRTWRYFENLPLTQYYKMALDNDLPFYNVHGGTQDNSSQLGPSRTLNQNGIRNSDWVITTGADGYACAVDPEDPNIIYAEWQNGSLNRYDKRSGELVDIKPQPDKGEEALRWNWDAPVIISPFSHTRLYFASQFVYRSEDRGDSWIRISPDLTRNIFRYEQKIMGKTWSIDSLWDHGAMSMFSTITSLTESPLQEGLIYVGTDDGLIQISEDGGKTWHKIDKIPGVPDYFFVNDIKASKHDKDTVFAALDNHKTGDLKPYLIKSQDRGRTWTSIAGDLPQPNIVWAIEQDHKAQDLLFIGAEFGIHFSLDAGKHWTKFAGGMPPIPFRDIEIQEREDDLVGASFGRSFFVLDDYSSLREINASALENEGLLFPVKKALAYVERRPLSLRGKAFLGDDFYLAPNPPYGAVFTYYLKDSLKTQKQKRTDRESQAEKAGKPVSFPGWDTLREEEAEEKPSVVITVTDQEGQVVRRLTGPSSRGIHRVAWDLCYPTVNPTEITPREILQWDDPPKGPRVVPGKFQVSLAKLEDGELIPLGESQVFVVESLGLATFEEKDKTALLAFQKEAGELQRAMMGAGGAAGDAASRLQFIKKALLDTPQADSQLLTTARTLEKRLQMLQTKLFGDRVMRRRSEPVSPSPMQRVNAQLSSTVPITATNRRDYAIAADEFSSILEELRQVIEVDLKKLETEMESAGAPWTPGRSLPRWKKK